MGDTTPQRGKVVAYTQASQPRTQASTCTHIKIMQTKKKKKRQGKSRQHSVASIKKNLKNQHMLAGSASAVLSLIIFVIHFTTERDRTRTPVVKGGEMKRRK